MKNPNIFCSRKGGATIKGKFHPIRTSGILSMEIERFSNKIAKRRAKALATAQRREYAAEKARSLFGFLGG